tara:strand:+ start:529 stop:714 length:186 start_codon:yes stop_codon:yes gene_type:complete
MKKKLILVGKKFVGNPLLNDSNKTHNYEITGLSVNKIICLRFFKIDLLKEFFFLIENSNNT